MEHSSRPNNEPLASRIRPKNLDEFIGQEHLVSAKKGAAKGPLRVAIEEKHLFSFILWGPPGVGKTTLARIYAKALNAEYHELSAVSAGKEDIKKISRKKAVSSVRKYYFWTKSTASTKPSRTSSCRRWNAGSSL